MKHSKFVSAFLLLFAMLTARGAVPVESGVSLALADFRAVHISDITYTLSFSLPESRDERVTGEETIIFKWTGREDLQLDFQGTLTDLVVNGVRDTLPRYEEEHIVVSRWSLRRGMNVIKTRFVSNDKSLNRNADYLYTLFVPDHARSVFPCFDQPSLKARFRLYLELPEAWKAMSYSKVTYEERKGRGRKELTFDMSEPLPTYLFSFTAGVFEEQIAERDGRTLQAFYRETDPQKVAQLETVFDQVAHSLRWLEDYTQIPLPFSKYGFVVLPGYQFGGMEHPGAIQYTDNRIFLGANPTPDEELSRAELIAHETSHMWFGDLVTMRWFNDVWTKEVFANYMSSKITSAQFPDINHDLNFLKNRQSVAMTDDRSLGTHPIQQPLDNLNYAGLLYGNIIYQKAPVMMRKLEELMGSDAFRDGLRKYLKQFSYANATWDDLIDILDAEAPTLGLKDFSEVWVKQKGMPDITTKVEGGRLIVEQTDPWDRGLTWKQRFKVGLVSRDTIVPVEVELTGKRTEIVLDDVPVAAIFPNMDGRGYGRFLTDRPGLSYQLNYWYQQTDDVARQAMLMNLYEYFLMHEVTAEQLYRSLIDGLKVERNQLVASTVVSHLGSALSRLTGEPRAAAEKEMWLMSQQMGMRSCRQSLMRSLFSRAVSDEVVEHLYQIWKEGKHDLLNQSDFMTLSYQLALRKPTEWQDIVATQRSRITNPDRLRQYDYISRACTPDADAQQALFDSLMDVENRSVEPWTQTLLSLLNHRLREPASNRFILPGLEELQEIQRTGDIFFPRNWCVSLLSGHRSAEAKQVVEQFLAERPDYPLALKNKLLQAAFTLLNQE